jgi:hypothetical protein
VDRESSLILLAGAGENSKRKRLGINIFWGLAPGTSGPGPTGTFVIPMT